MPVNIKYSLELEDGTIITSNDRPQIPTFRFTELEDGYSIATIVGQIELFNPAHIVFAYALDVFKAILNGEANKQFKSQYHSNATWVSDPYLVNNALGSFIDQFLYSQKLKESFSLPENLRIRQNLATIHFYEAGSVAILNEVLRDITALKIAGIRKTTVNVVHDQLFTQFEWTTRLASILMPPPTPEMTAEMMSFTETLDQGRRMRAIGDAITENLAKNEYVEAIENVYSLFELIGQSQHGIADLIANNLVYALDRLTECYEELESKPENCLLYFQKTIDLVSRIENTDPMEDVKQQIKNLKDQLEKNTLIRYNEIKKHGVDQNLVDSLEEPLKIFAWLGADDWNIKALKYKMISLKALLVPDNEVVTLSIARKNIVILEQIQIVMKELQNKPSLSNELELVSQAIARTEGKISARKLEVEKLAANKITQFFRTIAVKSRENELNESKKPRLK